MTATLLQLSDDVWEGRATMRDIVDPGTAGTEEVADGLLMVPGFSHSFAVAHDDGVLLFDTGSELFAEQLHRRLRAWTDRPVTDAVYSHGHIDHCFGLERIDVEAFEAGRSRPRVVAHERVLARFERYRDTRGYNSVINQRQFRIPDLQWPAEFRLPDVTYADEYRLEAGGTVLELTHHVGETDDHSVGWLPEQRVLFPGDLFLGVVPNCGNPQKVQRYPVEWARALRWMAGLGAELMLGSHGLPVAGTARIRETLDNTAAYLESLVEQTFAAMNAGLPLDDVVHSVEAPADLAALPYLQPLYDEPEFIVHNLWRQYAGWYDGDPAHLKPAPAAALAAELAALSGGASALADRALALAGAGDDASLRLAGHLAQLAGTAAPTDTGVHAARRTVWAARAAAERSVMARGIFGWAEEESARVVEEPLVEEPLVEEGR
jgi:alkyl sulfatase BDS1-like metallo-beta-lactamase superfamily hydrolase